MFFYSFFALAARLWWVLPAYMGQTLHRFWRSFFSGRSSSEPRGVELTQSLIVTSSALPDYAFRPTPAFQAKSGGDGIRFEVGNPFDLVLQERGLMANALVVDAVFAEGRVSPIWLRYDVEALSAHGMAACSLSPDEMGVVFEGVCGVLSDRRRV